jgi:hypothetical protein
VEDFDVDEEAGTSALDDVAVDWRHVADSSVPV